MIIAAALLIWAGLLIAAFARIECVHSYLHTMLGYVAGASECDIKAGNYTRWRARYTALSAVEFNTMVIQFWRRMDSFYPDQTFATCATHGTKHTREGYDA